MVQNSAPRTAWKLPRLTPWRRMRSGSRCCTSPGTSARSCFSSTPAQSVRDPPTPPRALPFPTLLFPTLLFRTWWPSVCPDRPAACPGCRRHSGGVALRGHVQDHGLGRVRSTPLPRRSCPALLARNATPPIVAGHLARSTPSWCLRSPAPDRPAGLAHPERPGWPAPAAGSPRPGSSSSSGTCVSVTSSR